MAKKSDTITIKKDDLWRYATFVLLAVVVIGGFYVFAGKNGGNSGDTDTTVNQPDTQPSVVEASVDDDPVLGDSNAPVTIIEFSDYQCPFCRKFWTETLPSLKSEYIDTGKVKFVYRDFPLTQLHPMAEPSAEAAECVREKGGDDAYWKMHDKIFTEQNIMDGGSANGPVTGTVTYTTTDLKSWAKDLGYDISSCLDSGKYKSEVAADANDAAKAGGRGTPYFVINDKALSGAYPFEAFKQIIDAELA